MNNKVHDSCTAYSRDNTILTWIGIKSIYYKLSHKINHVLQKWTCYLCYRSNSCLNFYQKVQLFGLQQKLGKPILVDMLLSVISCFC